MSWFIIVIGGFVLIWFASLLALLVISMLIAVIVFTFLNIFAMSSMIVINWSFVAEYIGGGKIFSHQGCICNNHTYIFPSSSPLPGSWLYARACGDGALSLSFSNLAFYKPDVDISFSRMLKNIQNDISSFSFSTKQIQ